MNASLVLWRSAPTRRHRACLLLGAALAPLLVGCRTSGLAFRQDERLDIVAPDDRAVINLPVEVRWTIDDFDFGDGAGSFAVFVDHAPQRPGRTLEDLYQHDEACRGVDNCPDAGFLAARNIFRTTDTSFVVDHVEAPSGDDRRRFHEVTVVLLGPDGRRLGESAWTVEFDVRSES